MQSWKWILWVAAAVVGLLGVTWMSCSSGVRGTSEPTVTDAALADAAEPTEIGEPSASEVTADDPPEASEPPEEAPPEASKPPEEAPPEPEPQTTAQKFVAAGGQQLCLAMVHALNPDWRLDTCKDAQPGPNGEDRRAECENQRRPLVKFAEDVCKVVIEESLRLDLDPGMVLAVIERESSFGRASWDRQDRRYEVQTNICELTLPKSRIVDRQPGRREGTELMTWTYGDRAPRAGQVARNRQPVIVVSEDDERIVLNTCAAGEVGIMQTIPREFRAGTVVEATGEVLAGSSVERRRTVETDPVLQVRLGCQAIASHRDDVPVDMRNDWRNWLFAYNTGSPNPTDHGREYVAKIVRHYVQACRAWMQTDPADPMSIVDVEDVWPECSRLSTDAED